MIELTSEQTPTRQDEYQRILQKNGIVIQVGSTMRVGGVLSVSRAIGDLSYKEWLISDPELNSVTLKPCDEFLILSTDGLFKTFSK